MPYLPHAVMVSTRDLAGRVVAVRIRHLDDFDGNFIRWSGINDIVAMNSEDGIIAMAGYALKRPNYGIRYQLLLDVELTQHPSRVVIRGVKLYAPLTITIPGGKQISAPRGKYDELINAILLRLSPEQRSLAKVEEYLNNQLKHTPVMLQTIGGVWTISQI